MEKKKFRLFIFDISIVCVGVESGYDVMWVAVVTASTLNLRFIDTFCCFCDKKLALKRARMEIFVPSFRQLLWKLFQVSQGFTFRNKLPTDEKCLINLSASQMALTTFVSTPELPFTCAHYTNSPESSNKNFSFSHLVSESQINGSQ